MTERLVDPLRLGRPLELERRERDRREPQPGEVSRKRRASSVTLLLAMLVAALVVVPSAVADDDDDDDGGGAPPTVVTVVMASGSGADQASIDLGATWQPAFTVTPHPLYSTIPGTQWISYAADKGDSDPPPPFHIRYRRMFDIPQGCTGTSLSVILHVDNDASTAAPPPGLPGGVFLNSALFGSTPPGALLTNFQDPPEGPYTTAGPFLQAGNVLEFRTNDYGRPTALDYEATLTLACGGGGEDDDDDDEDDDDGDDDDDDGDDDD
jgi:hypothetical protein